MCAGGEIPALISVPAFCALMFLSTCRTREADSWTLQRLLGTDQPLWRTSTFLSLLVMPVGRGLNAKLK